MKRAGYTGILASMAAMLAAMSPTHHSPYAPRVTDILPMLGNCPRSNRRDGYQSKGRRRGRTVYRDMRRPRHWKYLDHYLKENA